MSIDVVAPARDRSAAALLAAGILWGTGGLAGAMLTRQTGLHPLSVATYRLLLGGGLAVALLAISGGLRGVPRTRAALRRILVTGALLGFFQAAYFVAVQYTSVGMATMVTIGMLPVFVAIGTALRDRRIPQPTTLAAIAVAITGLALLTGSRIDAIGGWHLLTGVTFALAAAIGFALLTLITTTPVPGLDPLRTTAFGMLTGGLLLTPAALPLGMTLPLTPTTLATAAYLGSAPTALAYTAYFRGLRTAAPVFASLAALLEPLTATLLSLALLNEHLTPWGWTGAALLIAALALSSRR
ncbi:EamA family transporter [Nocardia sp. CDC159]|uniref:EamA family transporter n=1 Tax=Nocardia pulmonis TaxID=2951408 RepID=A0A9X2E3R2_9NOCA|nr:MULTISPECIES: EamA family transporter [Nocardia]MCM6773106.1 EamA family transporter [Nocardia pulmonis]MCM6785591.1 EamA family transporter [Nocardia sp. CDC159]